MKRQNKGGFVGSGQEQAKLPLLLCVFLLLLNGCSGGSCNVVPDRTVNISVTQGSHINLWQGSTPSFFENQGYAGVVMIYTYIGGSGQIYAFDMCSTVNPDQRNRITVKDGFFLDEKTGAKWLFDGSPAHLAECPLKGYPVTTSNNGFTYTVRWN